MKSTLATLICANLQKFSKDCLLKRVRDGFTSQLVNTVLTIAKLFLSKRRGLFNALVCYLFFETNMHVFLLQVLWKRELAMEN